MMLLKPATLRLIWAVVETVPSQNLLSSSDTALVSTLVQRASSQSVLSESEISSLTRYIQSKLSLIRDIADTRSSGFYAS